MPEELVSQMPIIEDVVRVFNIPVYFAEGYEADDCIATLTLAAEERGHQVKIYSGDLDLLQLVSGLTQVITTRRGLSDMVVFDHEMVRKRYGINPPQLVDYKALAGDSSDHIPGIPGIGEASASKLLNQFEDIEAMYAEPQLIPSRWRKQILENRDRAFLSKRLASLEKNLDLGIDWNRLRLTPPSREELKRVFVHLEFKSMLKKLGFRDDELEEIQEIVVQIVGKDEDLGTMLASLKAADCFSIMWIADEEDDLVGLSVGEGKNNGFYFPFVLPEQLNISSTFGISIYSKDKIIHEMKILMDNPDIHKYVYDLKSGVNFLRRTEYFTGKNFIDLMTGTYLLDPDDPPKSLEAVLSRYTDFVPRTINELSTVPKGRKKIRVIEIPLQDLTLFLSGRAVRLNNLGPLIEEKLQEAGLKEELEGIEIPLTILLAAVEARGIKVDRGAIQEEAARYAARMDEVATSIFREVGHEFNINSTRQLGKALFEEMHLPGAKMTSTGYRTDAELLSKMAHDHPVVEMVLAYREISRLKSAFIDSLLEEMDPETDKISITFQQNGTINGAITTVSPNLSAMPRQLRRIFIPTDQDRVFLGFAYRNLEMTLLAHLSGEEILREALEQGRDVGEALAEAIFGQGLFLPDEASKGRALEMFYGALYGTSAQALAQHLDIKRKDAKDFIDSFGERFPGVKGFMDRSLEEVRQNGFVRSMLGRRRLLPGISSQNKNIKSAAERTAIQFILQGGACDILRKTLVDCLEGVLRGHRDIHLLIHTGSEFLFETKKRRADKYTAQILEVIKSVANLSLPLDVEVQEGINWLDMKRKDPVRG
jgi:DNA polymerase-1